MLLAAVACHDPNRANEVRIGTTTSVHDTGLIDSLEIAFRRSHPSAHFAAIAGGTGEMLQLGRRGDLDVTLTHDPADESTYVARGIAVYRREIMWNDFLIAGPREDPAGIRGESDAARALARIAARKAAFASRGDDSGTHRRELALWRASGVDSLQRTRDWYLEAGTGMGETLRMADSRNAYVLTDRGTLLALGRELRLIPLSEGDPRLLNRYGLLRFKSAVYPAMADTFANWVTGPEGQRVIRAHGVAQYGRPLFHLPR